MVTISNYNEKYVDKTHRLGYAQYRHGTVYIRRSYKAGYKEYYKYIPEYDSKTQYVEFIGRAEVDKYILNVYEVHNYYVEDTETDTEINTETDNSKEKANLKNNKTEINL